MLFRSVLEDPKKNMIEYLKKRVVELDTLKDSELQTLGEKAKELKDKLEEEEIEKVHRNHGVRSGKGPDRKAGI